MTAVRVRGDAALSRGLHLGDGLFETVLAAAGRPCFLAEHLARLRASGAALGVPVPGDLEEFVLGAVPAMWAEEGSPPRAALRISVARGPWTGLEPADGAAPDVVLALRAAAPPPASVAAVVLDRPRIDPRSPLAGHKVLSWMDRVEARRRAREAGADVAVLRTTDGDVCTADAANLFVVTGGGIVTPRLDRGALPGVTRARVLAALRRAGRSAAEARIDPGALAAAGEVFLTSSLAGVVPLRSLDGRALPAPGPVAAWLAACVPAEQHPGEPPRG